eukprot:1311318-Pleurochrysis_carterae.AAC.1
MPSTPSTLSTLRRVAQAEGRRDVEAESVALLGAKPREWVNRTLHKAVRTRELGNERERTA